MDVVVTGSSGLIGTALRPALERAGHRMVPKLRGGGGGEALRWDPAQGRIDAGGLEGAGVVVNLAGESIGAKRWSEDQKAEHRPDPPFAERRGHAAAKYNQRMASACHAIAAMLVGYADRRRFAAIRWDDSDQSFAPQFPWFRLGELISEKADALAAADEP